MNDTESKILILNSSFEEIEKLRPFLLSLADWNKYEDDQFREMRLAVNEAVTNAIVHGNKEGEEKQVRIKALLKEDKLYVTVQDEGDGFDPEILENPLSEDNLLKESGRGIFLIKQHADEVSFLKGGTAIKMQFKLLPKRAK
jgi:serine/threonine-protein kinase RsbW